MSNPIESLLEEDHESLGRLFSELDRELTTSNLTTSNLATSNLAGAFALLDRFWALLAVHIRAEHLQLFPAITNVDAEQFGRNELPTFAEAEQVIIDLRSDHDFFMKELAQLVNEMREGATDTAELRRRLNVLKERLDQHNRVEEEQVYQWPVMLLDDHTMAELSEAIRKELNNIPGRFRRSAP